MNDTILVVDDNRDDCALLVHAFKQIGFKPEIVMLHGGQEALDYLLPAGKGAGQDRGAPPLLAILDLRMPRVGGLQVLERIRADANLRHLAVIILTASEAERDELEAKRLGVTLYFTKPADLDDYLGFASRVQELLSHLDDR